MPVSPERELSDLQERVKELNCLYAAEDLFSREGLSLDAMLGELVRILPPGWRYPEACRARVVCEGRVHQSPDWADTPWVCSAEVKVRNRTAGSLSVAYLRPVSSSADGPFLPEEVRLLRTIADRLGQNLQHRHVERLVDDFDAGEKAAAGRGRGTWRAAVALLRNTDPNLHLRVARKLMHHLCTHGVEAALRAAERVGEPLSEEEESAEEGGFCNFPRARRPLDVRFYLSDEPFELAATAMDDEVLMTHLQRWILEDRSRHLVKVLASGNSPLGQVADALRRFRQVVPHDDALPRSTRAGLGVSLIRRFLTEQLEFIKVAKDHVRLDDFTGLLDRMVSSEGSHGKLGGKSAGLFLAARILEQAAEGDVGGAGALRVPKSWYVASDGLLDLIEHNDLGEVIEQKYKEIDQVRQEYPRLVQLFKNAVFPAELVRGLSAALDDFGDRPVIVRSSSLLEDRLGTAFSGKYKSLFLANQGTKAQRLEALMDAVAEIYASTFGPDPIEYRRERGLLDFNEEMGLLLQEVVGVRLGRYFLPAFSGVAFSRNEFRWSARIRREDGLVRLVPGLGTRAVDRLSDDYPVLLAPGSPGLRTNVGVDEQVRYAPRRIDVIDLETNAFRTVDLRDLLVETGTDYPGFSRVFALHRDGRLQRPSALLADPARDDLVPTFQGLIDDTPFLTRVHALLRRLEESLGTPVDLEFASDGRDFYLLQCRPQSQSAEDAPASIPQDVPDEQVVFTARRFVSNGSVPEVTHLVYVDPLRYAALERHADLLAVGRTVGALNKLLPKRQFVLIGPGRWGSRGDIRLGVPVTYADINNTAVLIEVARRKGNYVPDLSFGTHFFQDLVEAGIRYLPLYPDDDGVRFNERFLGGAENILAELLPDAAALADVVRVIDVPRATGGRVLRVLMNADLDQAVALLASPATRPGVPLGIPAAAPDRPGEDHWRWRLEMAERIASEIDPVRFGVVAFYVFGSTKNATAGPASDIDLLIHFRGTEAQRAALEHWLDGWSLCLGEMNRRRCGYETRDLLDVHLVTDEDIAARSSFAVKIGAVTDAARRLPIGPRRS